MAQTRFNLIGMSMFYPLVLYTFMTKRCIPRNLNTEIIADTGDDGEYVREMLAARKPGLWSVITPQLANLGYNFKEMTNVTATSIEFPNAFFSVKDL